MQGRHRLHVGPVGGHRSQDDRSWTAHRSGPLSPGARSLPRGGSTPHQGRRPVVETAAAVVDPGHLDGRAGTGPHFALVHTVSRLGCVLQCDERPIFAANIATWHTRGRLE